MLKLSTFSREMKEKGRRRQTSNKLLNPTCAQRRERERTDIKDMQRGGNGTEIRWNTSLVQIRQQQEIFSVTLSANTFTFESCFMVFG